MPQERFRAALIGVGGLGTNILSALLESSAVQVVGLSDRDASAAAAAAEHAGCPAYADHRRCIVESRPQGVFLAVPPGPTAELSQLAAAAGAHVWAEAPLARRLSEAVGVCRSVEAAGRRLVAGAQRRSMSGYRKARALIGSLGQAYLIQAHHLFDWGPRLGWRGDRAAGGGVLNELGSHIFDLVVWLAGMPERVYAVAGAGRRGGGQTLGAPARGAEPVYDTEDTAVAVLNYGGGAAAAVTLSRRFSPVSEQLTIYGEAGSLSAGPDHCCLRQRDGAVVESFRDDAPPTATFARQVASFLAAAGAPAPSPGEATPVPYESSGWEHLQTVAVIAAAALSDRTGQSESPAAMLANYDVAPEDCLRFVPPEGNRP